MYKCKECGAEYVEKPDYCDCGNDEFEEVIIKENAVSEKSVIKDEYSGIKNENKETETTFDINKIKPQPASEMGSKGFVPPPKKKMFSEQYPEITRFQHSLDPISLTIFCICILLSIYVAFFAWNPVEQEPIIENQIQSVDTKNIPTIDKFWNSTPPKPQVVKQEIALSEEIKPTEVVTDVVKQILPTIKKTEVKPISSNAQKSATVQKTTNTAPKTTNSTQKTTAVPLKKTTATTKSVNTQAQQEQAKIQAQKAADEAAKKKAEQERLAAEAAQLKKLQAEQAKKAAEEKARQEAAAKQEYATYKINLRNTIGRKIDFTRVIGDGSCTVAFKIDSSGKLINRSFAKQSSNNTLNDAVYAAVMATPTYNPPPSAYNNETLNLNIKFSNGNFEITLP